jgi:hypothetical protein
MPLFDRVATLEVGEPGLEGFLAEDFRIAFEVLKSTTPQPNPISIRVYNLKEDTRDRIRRTTDRVILRAGYTEDVGPVVVAIGDVVDVVHQRASPDIITAITAGDGSRLLRTNKQSLSFTQGASAKEIIAQLANAAGIALRDIGALADAAFANGFAESGPFGDIMDKLAGKLNAEWSIQNGELQVTLLDTPTNDVAVDITPTSGLIGAPERLTDQGTPRSPSQKDGWIIRSLLRPSIEPGARILVGSDTVEGFFRVKELQHIGDTHGDDWVTLMSIEEI